MVVGRKSPMNGYSVNIFTWQKPVYLILNIHGCKACKIRLIHALIIGEILVQRGLKASF